MKKVFSLLTISALLFQTLTVAVTAADEPATLTPDLKDSSEEKEVGLLFTSKSLPTKDDREGKIFLVGTIFTGACPGFSPFEGDTKFFSKFIKSRNDLRVIIRNITLGFSGNENPYTDREYYNDNLSEGFNVRFGESHHARYLATKPGLNTFEYIIKDGGNMVDIGEFSIKIDKKVNYVNRDKNFVPSLSCKSYDNKGVCTSYRTDLKYVCP
jgi:hypothetical protein